MRRTSQCLNSLSVESHNTDISLASNTPISNHDRPIKSSREGQIKLFRAPRFFQSIPNQGMIFILP